MFPLMLLLMIIGHEKKDAIRTHLQAISSGLDEATSNKMAFGHFLTGLRIMLTSVDVYFIQPSQVALCTCNGSVLK